MARNRKASEIGKDLALLKSMCREVRDYLERTKQALDDQIRSYPTPIPRCDAQFNHLYEQRTRLTQQLENKALRAETDLSRREYEQVIRAFINSAPYGDGAEEYELKSRLKTGLAKL